MMTDAVTYATEPVLATGDARRSVGASARLAWLDVAKGLAIMLVVIGHTLGGLIDADIHAAWLRYAFLAIYSFHMPLFFFLTSLLVYPRLINHPDRFRRSLFTRLAYPYFLWSIVQMATILLIGDLANHPMRSFSPFRIVELLWIPQSQFWFLHALFIMHLFSLALVRYVGVARFLILAVMAKAVFLDTPIGDLSFIAHLPYYALGIAAGELASNDVVMARLRSLAANGAFVALVLVSAAVVLTATVVWQAETLGPVRIMQLRAPDLQYVAAGAITTLAALVVTMAVVLIAQNPAVAGSRLLASLGRLTMPIFVLHIMVIAATRILLLRIAGVDEPLVLLPVLFLAGLALPVIAFQAMRRLGLARALGLA